MSYSETNKKLGFKGTKSKVMPQAQIYEYLLINGLRLNQVQIDLINYTQTLPEKFMQTSPDQVEFFRILTKLTNAKKGIEIGTFTGLSALAFAQGLPEDGKLVCLDVSQKFTDIAKQYWVKAGIDKKIDLRIAPALETLNKMLQDQNELGSYDFAFIDADKENYQNYYEALLKLLRKGGYMIFDNVLWMGLVALKNEQDLDKQIKEELKEWGLKENDEKYQHMSSFSKQTTLYFQKFNEFVQNDERVEMVLVPIADGLTFVRKI